MHFEQILDRLPFLLGGTFVTLEYTLISMFFGLILGSFLALLRLSKRSYLRGFASFYVSIFRGTPLLVQLMIVYFATPQLFFYQITAFEAGILAFSFNSSAYVCEIVRAGINAVDHGQFEASDALALSYKDKMFRVILPQAIRNILPALVNEAVNLLKETALISVIGQNDLLRRANIISAETYLFFEPLMIVALVYYILVMGLSSLAKLLEKRLKIA